MNTSLYGALGGVVLALTTLGGFHSLLNNDADWVNNPDSPVYDIVASNRERNKLPIPVLIVGGLVSFGLFYKARSNCTENDSLWSKEGCLIDEMRALRDKMYLRGRESSERHYAPPRSVEHESPLDADEARGEYVGVYSPPGHHRGASGA